MNGTRKRIHDDSGLNMLHSIKKGAYRLLLATGTFEGIFRSEGYDIKCSKKKKIKIEDYDLKR